MNWSDLRLRLRALIFRRRVEQELRDELDQHIELQTRENIRRGMTDTEARRRAMMKFGGEVRFAEECRDERRITLIEHFLQDIRYAAWSFGRTPVFTTVAVLLLALSTGATTAIFSLAYRIIQEALPVRHPDELVELYNEDKVQRRFQTGFSHPGFQLFAKGNSVFSEMFAFTDTFKVDVARQGSAEFADAVFETGNMDSGLGLRPTLGRLINNGDDSARANADLPVVLSYSYWQKRFGGDPKVIGEAISINNNACVIVGVAPREFGGMIMGVSADVILPISVVERVRRLPVLNNAASLGLHVVGRRKPNLTDEQIRAALEPLYRSFIDLAVSSFPPAMAAGMRDTTSRWQLRVRSVERGANSDVQANLEQSLTILLSITASVFLIGCTNLVGLLLTRTEVRCKELSTRLAIGCSRGRLVRQMITESMLLAAVGGLGGLAISLWGRPVLLRLLTSRAAAIELPLDAVTPILALMLTVVAGLLLGIAPSLTAYRISQKSFATELSRTPKSKGRRGIVVAQVAASLTLLIVAAQFAHSLQNYRKLAVGFRPDHLVLFEVSARTRVIAYVRDIRERISQLPGVISVTHSSSPVGQLNWTTPIQVPGFQPSAPGQNWTGRNVVGPRFVETLGLQLIAGRDIETGDTRDKPSVVVVNESFANYYFKGQNPIGRSFSFVDTMNRPHTIVGVVKDARDRGLKTRTGPMAYSSFDHDPLGGMTFAVRIRRDPREVMGEIESAVRQADPIVPISPMRTMEAQIDESLQRERMLAALSSTFGGLASLVATIGIYGMLAYMITRRLREIAVRIVVGASPAQVVWLTVRESLILVAAGTAIGIPLSIVISKAIGSQLFGVTPADPQSFALAVTMTVAFAAAAVWVPTRRATRVDPNIALRTE
jgi:predicted permease